LFVRVGKQQLWTSKDRSVRLFPLYSKGQKDTLWKTTSGNALQIQTDKKTHIDLHHKCSSSDLSMCEQPGRASWSHTTRWHRCSPGHPSHTTWT